MPTYLKIGMSSINSGPHCDATRLVRFAQTAEAAGFDSVWAGEHIVKELASLDYLSGGGLIVGFGVGWSEAEYQALGIPFHERGTRADEVLAALRAIWTEAQRSYERRFMSV